MSQSVTDFAATGELEELKLSAQQLKAVELLVAGKSVTETAASLGVARETVSRWRTRDNTFVAAYNETLRAAMRASEVKLVEARTKAIERLVALAESEDPAIALKACLKVLRVNLQLTAGPIDPQLVEGDREFLKWVATLN